LGDIGLSYQCLKLTVVCDSSHAEAYNNLGALEHRKQNYEQANAHYDAAKDIYEAKYNSALLAEERGDYQACFVSASEALHTFEEHVDSQLILDRLQKLFLAL
jgi:tetratricopeptide (TPR) repeat protein